MKAQNNQEAKEIRKVSAPDMGLEPMTLRLKVWCSTDWANRAHSGKRLHKFKDLYTKKSISLYFETNSLFADCVRNLKVNGHYM